MSWTIVHIYNIIHKAASAHGTNRLTQMAKSLVVIPISIIGNQESCVFVNNDKLGL